MPCYRAEVGVGVGVGGEATCAGPQARACGAVTLSTGWPTHFFNSAASAAAFRSESAALPHMTVWLLGVSVRLTLSRVVADIDPTCPSTEVGIASSTLTAAANPALLT